MRTPTPDDGRAFGHAMACEAASAMSALGLTEAERLGIGPRAVLTIGQVASSLIDVDGHDRDATAAWFHAAREAFLAEMNRNAARSEAA